MSYNGRYCNQRNMFFNSLYYPPLQTLQLSDIELKVLNCYLNGMKQAQGISSLGIQRGSVNYRKACIRQKFQLCFGAYHGSAYSCN